MSDWYRNNHPPNPVSPPELAGQDPDERADKAEDDMWYVLQENDELKAKIEVQRWIYVIFKAVFKHSHLSIG